MKNSKALLDDFVKQIILPDDKEEIISIAYLVFEHLFGVSRTDILMQKAIPLDESLTGRLQKIIHRLNSHEPVQYILGEALFFGRTFMVNSSVLIPRPETEELVDAIIKSSAAFNKALNILDIGTGSGCIPITLNLEFENSKVLAIDVSHPALNVASENATRLNASVEFIELDILQHAIPFTDLDIIVSNPPYIAHAEIEQMQSNVTDYEPHLALFVSDEDPLIFYRVITEKAMQSLRKNGMLWFEINARFGDAVKSIMEKTGFEDVQILKDVSGLDRIAKGRK